VSALEFTRLTEGQHPETEAQMVRHRAAMEYTNADGKTVHAVEHRAGWDATFSAPKSVSLTALVGGDERVRDAHSAAVTVALTELEKYTQARIGGNHPAEPTGKFIAAKFEHDTARPVDGYAAPQLHTHAVIFNVTERADGSTRALQERSFFESKQYATAVYQSELIYRVRNLGYEIETGRSGAPEIKGYTQEYLDASSLRSRRIKDELEKSGFSGPKAAQVAAHATREKKHTLTPGQVLAAHKEVAAEYGNQPQQVVGEAHARNRTEQHTPDRAVRAREAVTYARDSLFEREAVAEERLIFRDALRRGMGQTAYADVRAEFDARREHGDFRSIDAAKYSSGRSFTTPETIAAERANVAHVLAGRNTVAPMMTAERAREQANTGAEFNSSQRLAIEEILNSTDRIHGLQGRAGSGKTSTLKNIREGAEKSSYTVEGFAPTSRATAQLRDAGIDATSSRASLRVGRRRTSPRSNIFTCSMNRALPARGRCSLSSTSSARRTGFWSSATRASIRAWTPVGLSSRCRTPGCERRTLTRSCAREISLSYFEQFSISPTTKLRKAWRCWPSRAASRRLPMPGSASLPSRKTMRPVRTTPSSSRPTIAAVGRAMRPCAWSCARRAHSQRRDVSFRRYRIAAT
jgi:conjugative relaxase-like TrwC/TraI family protein